jgi:RNA polymerase sigma-70 factor (ECF subfamily)
MSASRPGRPRLRLVPATSAAGQAASASAPPPSTLDDSQLLLGLRAGDPSFAGELYDRLRPVVDRTVRRLLGPADHDREDAVQSALLEIITSIDRFRGDSSLDGWASTVAAHIVYKRIRRRRLERAAFSVAPADEVIENTASASRHDEDLEAREVVDRVTGHLNQMDQGRAWAFLLHDVWGYDLRETAAILEVSVAAAQSRLVRGRHEIHARVAADPSLASRLAADDDASPEEGTP